MSESKDFSDSQVQSTAVSPLAVSVYVVGRTSSDLRYLLIRRCGTYCPGIWQTVAGRVEQGETAHQAAIRELREETCLELVLYNTKMVETFYSELDDGVAFAPVFVGFSEEREISLSPKEHDAFEWLPFEEAKKRLGWMEQKRVLSLLHEHLLCTERNSKVGF